MMNLEQGKIEQNIRVCSYDVDFCGNLTLPSLCNYFQEIAWEHAKILKIGFDDLKSEQEFWVLSRLHVKIYEYPRWTDEIKLVTWPKGIDGLFALRDFQVLNKNNEVVIVATSSWLILDAEKHRPQKINSNDYPQIFLNNIDAFIYSAQKLPSLENSAQNSAFEVKYTDIDVNKHVNNVRYIEWAINTQTESLIKGEIIDEMIVNFMGEASIKDQMKISLSAENKSVSIFNETRKKESCRIHFVYKK